MPVGAGETAGNGFWISTARYHYDRALVFFLLHEQPREWRERTLSEVLRVVKPGGKVIIVD